MPDSIGVSRKLWTDEDDVMYVGVIPFFLDNLADRIIMEKKG